MGKFTKGPFSADSIEDLEYLAAEIAVEVQDRIKELDLGFAQYRRDLDGVSSAQYLLLKMVCECLLDKRPDLAGIELCTLEEGI